VSIICGSVGILTKPTNDNDEIANDSLVRETRDQQGRCVNKNKKRIGTLA
jgi:hypothetical protein